MKKSLRMKRKSKTESAEERKVLAGEGEERKRKVSKAEA